MHNYTVDDVLKDDFDLNLLTIDNKEWAKLSDYFASLRDLLLSKKRAAATTAGRTTNYLYVNDSEILESQKILTSAHYLSIAFSSDQLMVLSSYVNGGNRRYVSWYLQTYLTNWISQNHSLAKKILFNKTSDDAIRSWIISSSTIRQEDVLSTVGDGTVISLPYFIQARLLEISNAEDCEIFLKSDFDKIKLSAHKKIGPLKRLDDMISDPHAMIRSYAISLLSPGDKRLAKFINDRSSSIFCEALSKISAEHIPMMLGSSHLKKKRAKDILNRRLSS